MRISRLISSLVILAGLFFCPFTAYAQDNPDYVKSPVSEDNSAHWALRGFSEIGMGLLFGTAAGGGALITGALIDPGNIEYTLLASALIYPAGVASGAILGGYLTDSKSTYWEPFVGAYAGALIADITAYYISDDYPFLSSALVMLLPIFTTLMVMECSHAREKAKDNRSKYGTTVMPLSFGMSF